VQDGTLKKEKKRKKKKKALAPPTVLISDFRFQISDSLLSFCISVSSSFSISF